MDGQPGHENPLMSLNSDGSVNEFPYDYVDDTNPVLLTPRGRNTNQPSLQSLSQWIDCPKTPHSYVEFLTENLEKLPTADVLESIGSPIGGIHAVDGVSEIQRELLHGNEGKAFSSGPDGYSLEAGQWNLKLSAYPTEINNHEASASERFLSRNSSSEYEFHAQQNHASWMQKPEAEDCNVSHLQSKETISAPSFQSQPLYHAPKSRAAAIDRQRRLRIDESIKALQELLPSSSERGLGNALDDIIDYVKFLQLQVKGYGHYVLHEQMINEPLEEMMAKLLEINPSAATQLLESRGLYMMPRALVDDFCTESHR
ncbi:hypothetical protein ES288_A11G139300v1 [Gossypium darwinii]|uniref:BHLH domain-containing protein n=2 Tax=Gossypium TaxID=3633 RepID=A0A5D2N9Q5_GOSTO|nr:hypothetical protein ES288_A11G139300v1 [Gossypium darwinii]TYI00502.1 hypothetical protein ES332_A11G138300v1 [Gossypium tomentosum]